MNTYIFVLRICALVSVMMACGMNAIAQEDEIIVRAVRMPDEKRVTSEVSSVLDSVSLARMGDSNIAGALRRVTGLSIDQGKFVIVRGLNARYNTATLNGSPIPSPEPLKRTAPLDLFPTSIISSSLVQKTFSPDYSGEFGGGFIDLRTKRIPTDNFAEISGSISMDTETSLRDGLTYAGGDTDWWGYDDTTRALPHIVSELSSVPDTIGITPAEQNQLDVSFDQRDTLLISREDLPITTSAKLSFGRAFDFFHQPAGSIFYIGYNNQWLNREGVRQRPETFDGVNFQLDTPEDQTSRFAQSTQDITLAVLSAGGIELASLHELGFTAYMIRKSSKTAELADETDSDASDTYFRRERTDWIERQIWQTQFTGEHVFGSMEEIAVNWRVAYGEAQRDAPYERQTTYEADQGGVLLFNATRPSYNSINFSRIRDENFSAAGDILYTADVGGVVIDLKVGLSYSDTSRVSDRRLFLLEDFHGDLAKSLEHSRADVVFDATVLALDPFWEFQSGVTEPDQANGAQEVKAAYLGMDFDVTDYLRAAIGGRYEEATQVTGVYSTSAALGKDFENLSTNYFLPAVTLTWNPVGNFQVRAGYSQTITRPQFREVQAIQFRDPESGMRFFGNPFLRDAEIVNYDARAEWYFSRGEFMTFGVFYKEFSNPIEDTFRTIGDDKFATFVNAPEATLLGVEVELERHFMLADIIDKDAVSSIDLMFKTNYTWSQSQVTAKEGGHIILASGSDPTISEMLPAASAIVDGSRLVGQSDHLFNVQLGINDDDRGLEATLLVNYASERIKYRGEPTGTSVLPAVMEEPGINVDFVVNREFDFKGGLYKIEIKAKNLLGEEHRELQEDARTTYQFNHYDRGRSLSMTLKRYF